jgi:hypothetical protein
MAIVDDEGWLNDGILYFSITDDPEQWQAWLEHKRPFHVLERAADGCLASVFTARPRQASDGLVSWYGYACTSDDQLPLYLGTSAELTLSYLRRAISFLIARKPSINGAEQARQRGEVV